MSRNHLIDETSPYLLQHKDNPVHWHAWSDEAFLKAKQQNKPILLSVGYAACHWCHVMAHESFEDDAIAAQMNHDFINIKVDREERPDVDNIYQTAIQLMGEHGGWPLTVFLTPDGKPFWGGTYFPPSPRYGRPGFPQILHAISDLYESQPARIVESVERIGQALNESLSAATAGEGELSVTILNMAAEAAAHTVDTVTGGSGGAPKFPQPMFYRALWHGYLRTGNHALKNAVTLTLDNICQGGIYDHLAGGFARYATDERWLIPHFEKMLYDNALLVDLLCDVWLGTQSALYKIRVAETIDWMLTDLRAEETPDGGFALASAYDADSEGEEGKFYVWSDEEISNVLGSDAEIFRRVYDVSTGGNWEGHNILNRLYTMFVDLNQEAELAPLREKLLAHRAGRVPPMRDDKVLVDWNALAISAIARAGAIFDRADWRDAAKTIYAHVTKNMTAGDKRLRHALCSEKLNHPATLEDYANLASAAITLFEVTADRQYLADAEALADTMHRHYRDDKGGGYFLSADDTNDLIARSKPVFDNAVPSGNGTATEVFAKLYLLTGNDDYRQRVDTSVQAFARQNVRENAYQPTLCIGWALVDHGTQIVIVEGDQKQAANALHETALRAENRLSVVQRLSNTSTLTDDHPAFGKTAQSGTATAYVCVGPICGLPITDAESLADALKNNVTL